MAFRDQLDLLVRLALASAVLMASLGQVDRLARKVRRV